MVSCQSNKQQETKLYDDAVYLNYKAKSELTHYYDEPEYPDFEYLRLVGSELEIKVDGEEPTLHRVVYAETSDDGLMIMQISSGDMFIIDTNRMIVGFSRGDGRNVVAYPLDLEKMSKLSDNEHNGY